MATRLQHTIGVFSLVAYFCPDWVELRIAALLHDIGHSPFSHVLEQIEGIDHHRKTRELLFSSEIGDILADYSIDPSVILDLIEGNIASPLRNKENKVHLDHLDSWLRSAQITGLVPSPGLLLSKITRAGDHITMDGETAETVLQCIISEAKFHCSAVNIGPNAILKQLITNLLEEHIVSVESISDMTDARVEAMLLTTGQTREEAHRLFYRPHEIKVTRSAGNLPEGSLVVALSKLYLSEPLITNQEAAVQSLPSYPPFKEFSSLLGTYYIYWL
ncbi:HD domain protein [compost metagenome]